jgi:hypothetical protein
MSLEAWAEFEPTEAGFAKTLEADKKIARLVTATAIIESAFL